MQLSTNPTALTPAFILKATQLPVLALNSGSGRKSPGTGHFCHTSHVFHPPNSQWHTRSVYLSDSIWNSPLPRLCACDAPSSCTTWPDVRALLFCLFCHSVFLFFLFFKNLHFFCEPQHVRLQGEAGTSRRLYLGRSFHLHRWARCFKNKFPRV